MDLEALVLSGALFNDNERSSSPARSESPDKGWHDDELNLEDLDDLPPPAPGAPQESIGMGPGRTGVKGVIRDRDEAEQREREGKKQEMEQLRQRMERSTLTGLSHAEEERMNIFGTLREGRFGHLREVGKEGFLGALENEQRGTWVIVHLYDASLDRCDRMDDTLAKLARQYPDTKFLRCRASALGFASLPKKDRGKEEYYEDDEEYHDEEDVSDDEDNVDLDMLPTMLVYRDGDLEFNWVRVDWEAKDSGVEELLQKHKIISSQEISVFDNIPSDTDSDSDSFELDL